MVKNRGFQSMVVEVLNRHGFSAERFAKLADISPRTVQHWVHGDHSRPSTKNARKFYRTLAKLEVPEYQNKPEKVMNLAGTPVPFSIRHGNVVLTIENVGD